MQGVPEPARPQASAVQQRGEVSDSDKGLAAGAVIAALLAGVGIDAGLWSLIVPSAVATVLSGGLFAARHIFPVRKSSLGIF